jgi:hypothetical protein
MFSMYNPTPPYPGSLRGPTQVHSPLPQQRQRPQCIVWDGEDVVSVVVGKFEKTFVFVAGVGTHGPCLLDFEMTPMMAKELPLLRLLRLPCAIVWSEESGYCLVQLTQLFKPSVAQKKRDDGRTVKE